MHCSASSLQFKCLEGIYEQIIREICMEMVKIMRNSYWPHLSELTGNLPIIPEIWIHWTAICIQPPGDRQ